VTDFTIEHEESESRGRYFIKLSDAEAELTYSRAGETTIIIDHTGVPDALRGVGLGEALVQRAVSDARERGLKVIPLCPFAKAQIDKRPEWQDVL
jgi:hypothetical protein